MSGADHFGDDDAINDLMDAKVPVDIEKAKAEHARIKQALEDLDDEFFNGLARTVNAIPEPKRSLGRVFAHALVKHPQLIPVAARFFI